MPSPMACLINKQGAKTCKRFVAYLAPIRLDMAIPISVLTPNFLDAAAAAPLGQLLLRARNQLLTPNLCSIMRGPQNKLYKAILTPTGQKAIIRGQK